MYNFNYIKPGSVDEAAAALTSGDAMAMSGGQTLLPTMKARLAQADTLVDLHALDPAAVGLGDLGFSGGNDVIEKNVHPSLGVVVKLADVIEIC